MNSILNLDDFTKIEVQINGNTYELANTFQSAINFEQKYNELSSKYNNDFSKATEDESNALLLIIFDNQKEPVEYINTLAPTIQINVVTKVMSEWLAKVFPKFNLSDEESKKKVK